MNNLISLQDAIVSVASAIWHYPNELYTSLNCFENCQELAERALNRLPSAEPEERTETHTCDCISRQDVEDMLQNALPSRGMWEIEGDVVKNTICETVADLMMDLGKLPSAEQDCHICRDCKLVKFYGNVDKNGNVESMWFCTNWDSETDEEGFCHEWESK